MSNSKTTKSQQCETRVPASGRKLNSAVAQAIAQLQDIAREFDYEHEGWPPHAKMWRAILEISKDYGVAHGFSPNISKTVLAEKTGEILTGRKWDRFVAWYEKNIAPELQKRFLDTGAPPLRPIRVSNSRGGDPAKSCAIVFLMFDENSLKPAESIVGGSNETIKPFNRPPIATEMKLPWSSTNYRPSIEISSGSSDWVKKLWDSVSGKNSSAKSGDGACSSQRRWRFGASMALFSVFLLELCSFLPETSRGMFILFSVVLIIIGIYDMDKGNMGISR